MIPGLRDLDALPKWLDAILFLPLAVLCGALVVIVMGVL